MKYLFLLLLLTKTLMVSSQENDPWTVYMTPSEKHDMLSVYVREFQMEIEMNGLNEPVVMNSSHQMILGGRFLELRQNGQMMGMDYESIYTIGFNTIDSTFSMTTITNMGTGTLALQGKWDQVTKIATLFGKSTNPVSGRIINVRQTLNFVDEKGLTIESFDQEGDRPERKIVEYKFSRR